MENRMKTAYLYGTKEMGKVKKFDDQSLLALSTILEPHSLSTSDFSWAVK